MLLAKYFSGYMGNFIRIY